MQVLEERRLEIEDVIKEEQVRSCFESNKRKKCLVNIFDIDGTIMENIFPPLKNGEKAKEDKETIEQLREKLSEISLYTEFIEYYISTKNKTLHNLFITGRKATFFSDITIKQLEPLQAIKPYILPCHYPDDKALKLEKYYKFKIMAITRIIIKLLKKYSRDLEVRIFDDDNSLFEAIYHTILFKMNKKGIKKNLSYMAHQIKVEDDWRTINQGFNSFSMYINHLEGI